MDAKEFLAAVERDRVNDVEGKKRRAREKVEDDYYDAISDEIDKHPIHSPRSQRP